MLAGMGDCRTRCIGSAARPKPLLRNGVDELGFALWLLRRIALDEAELVELDRAAAAALAAELDAAELRQSQPRRARRPWKPAPRARMRVKAQRTAWLGGGSRSAGRRT